MLLLSQYNPTFAILYSDEFKLQDHFIVNSKNVIVSDFSLGTKFAHSESLKHDHVSEYQLQMYLKP